MKTCIFGSGAMGSSFGGILFENGFDVTLVDTYKEHIQAINNYGLTVCENDQQRTIRVKAISDINEMDTPPDLVILFVKSYHTRNAIEQIKTSIPKKTAILSMQNGIGNEDCIEEILGPGRALGGITYTGAFMIKPGVVSFNRNNRITIIGEMDGRTTERLEEITKMFNESGIATKCSDDIASTIWNKLFINVAVSPTSALTGLSHGQMNECEFVKDCAFSAVEEAINVAKLAGITVTTKDPREIWKKATEGQPELRSSMLKDIDNGSRTEIDVINGAVVKYGKKVGISTPINETLVRLIKGVEFKNSLKTN